MEITYYFECYSIKSNATTSKCFTIEIMTALFTFDMPFDNDYIDINSAESEELWDFIKPLLIKSFGAMEILIEKLRISGGSVVIEVEINLNRDLVEDMKSLLKNDKEACEKYLDKNIKSNESMCWFKNAREIFKGYNLTNTAITAACDFNPCHNNGKCSTIFQSDIQVGFRVNYHSR